ncbi:MULTISPECIES: glycosyltransferase [unclassified Levilactobacillus]|uniref:glycosyltransferase n=1 Tax=Lactobacillaceae TaxID=33958 RepID=UPI0014568480|nr:glycosyltransferase [Lactobacillus sp. HBUAS51381]
MNYFVDTSLGSAVTGIEKAQFNRMQLFQTAGMPATLLYLSYGSRLHEHLKKFGFQGVGYSMYDYFQESQRYADVRHFDWRHYWEKTCHYHLRDVENTQDVRVDNENGLFLMYAHFLDKDDTRVDYINYFDQYHHKIRREVYDSRGFLSRTSLLAEKGVTGTELYYNPDRQVKLIKQFEQVNGKTVLREITLKDYQQRDYFFNDEAELRTFFFDELARPTDIFFTDRNGQMAPSLVKTRPDIKICPVFHSTHVRVGQDIVTGELKHGIYDYILAHPERFNGIVVSTEQQRDDLLARYQNLPPISAIPVGFATPHPVDVMRRDPYRIISVARYSPEKQLLHQVKAIARLLPEFPKIQLHMLGYGQKIQKELQQYIDEHHLKDHVFLRGFQKDLTQEYQQASLALMTSVEEGFSLSTVEELSYGVPVIGYDIRYGPNEMIHDGENGFLVPVNDQEQLYQKMREYLSDLNLQRTFMGNAQRLVQAYSPTKTRQKWENLVQSLNNPIK